VMDVLSFRAGDAPKVRHPGTHNGHPVSAAAGIAMLDAVADGAAQSMADETAGHLRAELDAAIRRAGVAGFVHGASSTFRIVLGAERPTAPPDEWWRVLGTAALKQGMALPVLDALQAGMMLEGVHLFQGRGFVSTAHDGDDVERTAAALERTLRRMRQESIVQEP
jgi:glutamate-1-semialdehyde 2,1-aminomutase